jgi:DNA-binding LacI/PurR family transcriptional regulator
VGCDHFEGTKLLVEHLLERGHRQLAIFSGPNESAIAQERLQGAISQLNLAGAHYDVYEGDYSYDSAAAMTTEMMSSNHELPQAVICANDMMAIGCIDTLRAKYALRIPEDLSVVGFDGIAASKWQAYELTTIVQPFERMVEATVSMLMERIEDSSVPAEKRQFSGKLKVGLSA